MLWLIYYTLCNVNAGPFGTCIATVEGQCLEYLGYNCKTTKTFGLTLGVSFLGSFFHRLMQWKKHKVRTIDFVEKNPSYNFKFWITKKLKIIIFQNFEVQLYFTTRLTLLASLCGEALHLNPLQLSLAQINLSGIKLVLKKKTPFYILSIV